MKYQNNLSTGTQQQGAVLVTALILLVLLTMLGVTSMSTTTMEERMAANSQEINRAFQAASTGLEIVFNDGKAFDTRNTIETDGGSNDPYSDPDDPTRDKSDSTVGGTGSNAYLAKATYNSVYRQSTTPPRGSGWDSTFAYYHFDLSSTGTTASGASSTLHAGAYQVGKAQ
jgi:Tfp pilus assembly protein PilX